MSQQVTEGLGTLRGPGLVRNWGQMTSRKDFHVETGKGGYDEGRQRMCSWGQVAAAPVQTQQLTVGDLEQVI